MTSSLPHTDLARAALAPGVTALGQSFNDSIRKGFGAVTAAALNAGMTAPRRSALRHRQRTAIETALLAQRWARHGARGSVASLRR